MVSIKQSLRLENITNKIKLNKGQLLTRGIRHGWVRADSTSRISSQPQFRSDTQTLV